jgi:hypothetical protein
MTVSTARAQATRRKALSEVAWRIAVPIPLLVGFAVLAVLACAFVIFGRSQRRTEIARGMSRTLNGCWDGTGDVTFSANSYNVMLKGKPSGKARVRFVDGLFFNGPDHCRRAYLWHADHHLFDPETDAVD